MVFSLKRESGEEIKRKTLKEKVMGMNEKERNEHFLRKFGYALGRVVDAPVGGEQVYKR